MKTEHILSISLVVVQILLILITFDLKKAFQKMVNSIKYNLAASEPDLTTRIARIVSQFRKAEEMRANEVHFNDLEESDVMEQVAMTIKTIKEEGDKDVRIIISIDKINQGNYETRICYRLDDPV